MPTYEEGVARRERRRRELLQLLLEEEQEGAQRGAEAELLALLAGRRAKAPLGGLLSSEQLQGFVWGLGAATLLLMILPTAKEKLRPFAVSTLKGAMDLVDQLKTSLGEAGEGLQDLIAEAQFERMKAATEPNPAQAPAPGQ